jgi:hypothetical protein
MIEVDVDVKWLYNGGKVHSTHFFNSITRFVVKADATNPEFNIYCKGLILVYCVIGKCFYSTC